MNEANKTYQLAVLDMYDYGHSYNSASVETWEEAVELAKKMVLRSVDWKDGECGYEQWLQFGEDVIITPSKQGLAHEEFSGESVIRQRCQCSKCKDKAEEI